LRLSAEPALAVFDIDARVLESQPTGAEALEPCGYDIFEPKEATFDPPSTGPVPSDYVLGPGDTVRLHAFRRDELLAFDVVLDAAPASEASIRFDEKPRASVKRLRDGWLR